MNRFDTGFLLSVVLFASCGPADADEQKSAADPQKFQAAVRTTDPLTPEEQLSQLHVPEGFSVSLFASEHQIQKPLNMQFDADGRLWVTASNQYPYPADGDSGTDAIYVLEDTDHDGRSDKVTTFADDLNIPIGLYPYRNGAIVFSIPNIWYLEDTDGDGKSDRRTKLYGPFDVSRDTHGMNNAFRRGFDGWLYCCHGFNNQSQVSGSDGHQVTMHSGNTYRIRLDGSRIEHFTHGQVNPFGMTIDANGDIFTSDCHTKPVMLLMRDGYCESFGKPHDGLGFIPHVMNHLHGSTAIDGLCQYQDSAFPADYHDDLFVGNVMTCRVHRNSIVRTGASITMQEEPDFLVSDDPWFRPVDIQIGPDGAMYVADFYNRIIGHYEVALNHPGRDRERGRIWRIAWTGEGAGTREITKLENAGLAELLGTLSNDSKSIRQRAADQIVDRIGRNAAADVRTAFDSAIASSNYTALPQLLWVLQRLGAVTSDDLVRAFSVDDERTQIHVMRVASEAADEIDVTDLIRQGLRNSSAMVQRVAADAAGRHPSVDLLKEVINASVVAPVSDVHLKHALKIALRNQLREQSNVDWFTSQIPPAEAIGPVREVVPGLSGPVATQLSVFLLTLDGYEESEPVELLKHAAAHANESQLESLAELVVSRPSRDVQESTSIWLAISDSLRLRGVDAPAELQDWSRSLAEQILDSVDTDDIFWGQYSLDGSPAVRWGIEQRFPEAGTSQKTDFLSSLPGGEAATGVIRSRAFVVPFELTVRVCGHLGNPQYGPVPANRVLLRDAKTGEQLASVLAPRNDVASVVEWDLIPFAGRRVFLEVVDGMTEKSYAWIGFGSTSPPVAKPSTFDDGKNCEQLETAIRIIRQRQTQQPQLDASLVAKMENLIGLVHLDGSVRSLAAEVLLRHHDRTSLVAFTDLLQIASTPLPVADSVVELCRTPPAADAESLVKFVSNTFRQLDGNLRTRLVKRLAESRAGGELLLAAIETGVPGPAVLRDPAVAQRLSSAGSAAAERVATLVESLPPPDADQSKLAAAVLRRLQLGKGDSAAGALVFRKNCATCHRRNGDGGVAGPQLDGVRTRGPQRLLEDILQPNQNVDINFRTSTLVMTDGRLLSGLVQRNSGPPEVVRVTDVNGKVTHVNPEEIDEESRSNLSLMPANVATTLKEDDLLNLLTWLME